jgi:hypothetical protein
MKRLVVTFVVTCGQENCAINLFYSSREARPGVSGLKAIGQSDRN